MIVTGSPEVEAPRPKVAMPPLETRARRPPVVRLRKHVVVVAVMSAAGLVAGSLAWAFVVQPELRRSGASARLEAHPSETRGVVRPSEAITHGPVTYADVDRLPEPRSLGGRPGAPPATPVGVHRPPSVLQARSGAPAGLAGEARASRIFFAAAGVGAAGAVAPGEERGRDPDDRDVYNPHALRPALSPYEVKAGAVLPAALLTAVDTARSGPVTAAVTENVFDTVSGRHLLIPQGSRLVGVHEGESRHGDKRAFITWDRLILPNGKSLVLQKAPGVDAQGAVGVPGDVDRRLGPLAMATLFGGAITALGQAARDHDHDEPGGWLGDAGDAAAITAAQVGGKLIDRELDVRPSIRLRPGARVRVFVTRDLILEPYQP